jgi:hypothetical protein
MISANKMFLVCCTTIMMMFRVDATTSPFPLLDIGNNITANETENSRLFNNDQGKFSFNFLES